MRIKFLELDSGMGNFDVLLANIGILTASSFALTFSHVFSNKIGYMAAFSLGIFFMANQLDESFSHIGLSGIEELSGILICLYAHLSHLTLCVVIFAVLVFAGANKLTANAEIHFVSAY